MIWLMIPESYFGFSGEMGELFEFKSVTPVMADPVDPVLDPRHELI